MFRKPKNWSIFSQIAESGKGKVGNIETLDSGARFIRREHICDMRQFENQLNTIICNISMHFPTRKEGSSDYATLRILESIIYSKSCRVALKYAHNFVALTLNMSHTAEHLSLNVPYNLWFRLHPKEKWTDTVIVFFEFFPHFLVAWRYDVGKAWISHCV